MWPLSFSHPLLLAVAALPLLLLLLRWVWSRRSRGGLPASSSVWIPGVRPPVLLQRISWACGTLAMFCLVLLLAGIRAAKPEQVPIAESSAIVIALDASSSMTAEDFVPRNRLEEAKTYLAEFVRDCPGVEIGLIQFAAAPTLIVPVTPDHAAVTAGLESVAPAEFGEDGTAIGSAIAGAVNRLRSGSWSRRDVLLITDGVNNRGNIAPIDAARIAAAFSTRITTIGIGTDRIARFWVPTAEGALQPVEAEIVIDEEALRSISTETGGEFRRVRSAEELRGFLRHLAEGRRPKALGPGAAIASAPRWLATLALFLFCAEFLVAHVLYAELTL